MNISPGVKKGALITTSTLLGLLTVYSAFSAGQTKIDLGHNPILSNTVKVSQSGWFVPDFSMVDLWTDGTADFIDAEEKILPSENYFAQSDMQDVVEQSLSAQGTSKWVNPETGIGYTVGLASLYKDQCAIPVGTWFRRDLNECQQEVADYVLGQLYEQLGVNLDDITANDSQPEHQMIRNPNRYMGGEMLSNGQIHHMPEWRETPSPNSHEDAYHNIHHVSQDNERMGGSQIIKANPWPYTDTVITFIIPIEQFESCPEESPSGLYDQSNDSPFDGSGR